MWYNHLDVPRTLKAQYNEDCCFAFLIDFKQVFMCMQDENHCILKSRQVMKTIYNGCMMTDKGNKDLSSGPSINGEPMRKGGTEITGEQIALGTVFNEKEYGKQVWNLTNLSRILEEEE